MKLQKSSLFSPNNTYLIFINYRNPDYVTECTVYIATQNNALKSVTSVGIIIMLLKMLLLLCHRSRVYVSDLTAVYEIQKSETGGGCRIYYYYYYYYTGVCGGKYPAGYPLQSSYGDAKSRKRTYSFPSYPIYPRPSGSYFLEIIRDSSHALHIRCTPQEALFLAGR